MKLSYTKFEHGWLVLHVETEGVSYSLWASSVLNDVILDLINAAIQLQKQSKDEYVVFWEEPSSHVWHLQQENNRIAVTRYYLEDYAPFSPFASKILKEVEPMDAFETDLKTLTNQVIRFVSAFQDSPGIEEYQKAWRFEFPRAEMKALKELRQVNSRAQRNNGLPGVPAK